MDFVEFKNLLDSARALHPGWFMLPADSRATEKQLADAQSALGIRLPTDYGAFLSEYGGGDFVFTNIFSVEPDSEWNIVRRNTHAQLSDRSFLGISDDETGGLYGYRVKAGECLPSVYYLDLTTRELTATAYVDSLSFIAAVGLQHQPE